MKIKTKMAEEDILPLLGLHFGNGEDDDSENEDDSEGSDLDESDGQHEADEGRAEKKKKKEGPEPSRSVSFDSSLPSSHSYLGTDLEEIRGRKFMDDDSVVTLPLVTLPGTILVPGHIIPLYSHHPQEVAMLKAVVDSQDKTFGVVALRHFEHSHSIAGVGTTAEIYSVKNEMDEASGISTITVLAQGRQRFQLNEYNRTITGTLVGKVKILPDVVLENVLDGARPASHCKFCCQQEKDEDTKVAMDRQGRVISCVQMKPRPRINKFSAAHYTWWPPWVYKMYDTESLVLRVKTELQKWNETLVGERIPSDATTLSYWMTQNLPLDDSLKLQLLSINTAQQRLRCALNIIVKCSVMCCRECNEPVAEMSDVFSLSVEGPLGAYVNPGGHVHETLTVYKAQNLSLIGRSSTEHSWFPGYAWTIAQCSHCSSHIGWKFTTKRKDLVPHKFWGLCRSSLVPGMVNPDEHQDNEWTPTVM